MPRWTPWASSHPSAPTENAVVHATVLCGLATQTSSTGRAMASNDRAAADAPATTARRRSGHPCSAMASEWSVRWRARSSRLMIPSSSPVPAAVPGGHAGQRAIAAEIRRRRRAGSLREGNRPVVPAGGAGSAEVLHDLAHQVGGRGRRLADLDPGSLECLLLGGSGAGGAGHDRAGVSHRLALRRGEARDVADDRPGDVLPDG